MKIGILSFAHLHAEAYINNLRNHPDVEMIGIADENIGRGQYFANKYDTDLFPSYEALLAEKPDGVIVCSENVNHRPLVEMAAKAGVNILSEKPLALSLEDCQAMLATCQENKVMLMTAFPMRFSPALMEIKKMLDENGLGKIYSANGANQGQVPSHHRAWFVDKNLAGGGAILDHTVHLADILRWYLQEEVVEVYAQTNQIIQAETVDVETGGLVMLTFESGTFATIDCSWSRPKNYPTWGGLNLELIGERGIVNVDAFKQNLSVYGRPEQHTIWVDCGPDANQGMVNEFIAAIKENREAAVTGFDGLKAVEIALAAYQSAQSGQPVQLPLE
jgi:predicted dehydrogenase